MNWEAKFNKHIEKTIKNTDKFEIEEKHKLFMKTSFLLADTTIRMFVYAILEAGPKVTNGEVGWVKRLKKIDLEQYQYILKMFVSAYIENTAPTKDYSEFFDLEFVIVGLQLEDYFNLENVPTEMLKALEIKNNLENDFVLSTLNYFVSGYFDRLDKALLRNKELVTSEQ